MLKLNLLKGFDKHINTFIRRNLNSNIAILCRENRKIFLKKYPTHLVLEDGSSIRIRYHEPRQIIKLPLDLSKLTEDQAKKRLDLRKPKTKVTIIEFEDDNFDANKYINLMK